MRVTEPLSFTPALRVHSRVKLALRTREAAMSGRWTCISRVSGCGVGENQEVKNLLTALGRVGDLTDEVCLTLSATLATVVAGGRDAFFFFMLLRLVRFSRVAASNLLIPLWIARPYCAVWV